MKWSKSFTLPNGYGYVEISRSGDIATINDIKPKSFFSWDTEEEFNKILEDLLVDKMCWDGGIKKSAETTKSESVKTPLNSSPAKPDAEEFKKRCIDREHGCGCNELGDKSATHGNCGSAECRKNNVTANRLSKMKSYRDLRKNDKSKPIRPCTECACSSINMFGDTICHNPNSLRFEEIVGKYAGCKLFIPKPRAVKSDASIDATSLILEKLEGIEKRLTKLENSESDINQKRAHDYPKRAYDTTYVYCATGKPAYSRSKMTRNSQYRKKPFKYSTSRYHTETKFADCPEKPVDPVQTPDAATDTADAATTTAVRRRKPTECL